MYASGSLSTVSNGVMCQPVITQSKKTQILYFMLVWSAVVSLLLGRPPVFFQNVSTPHTSNQLLLLWIGAHVHGEVFGEITALSSLTKHGGLTGHMMCQGEWSVGVNNGWQDNRLSAYYTHRRTTLPDTSSKQTFRVCTLSFHY